jgi:hypothetical protein
MNTIKYLAFLTYLLLTRSILLVSAETYDFSKNYHLWGLCKIEFTGHFLSPKVKLHITPLPGMPFCYSNVTIEHPTENEEAFSFSPGRIFFKVEGHVVSLLEIILYSKHPKTIPSSREVLLEKALRTFFKGRSLSSFTYKQMLQVKAQSTPFVPLFISHEPCTEDLDE